MGSEYRISVNSFCGNNFFFEFGNCRKFKFNKGLPSKAPPKHTVFPQIVAANFNFLSREETIQGQKLFAEIRYVLVEPYKEVPC